MTLYQTTGNLDDLLPTEGTERPAALDDATMAVLQAVLDNINPVKAVAAAIPGLASIPASLTAAQASATAAAGSATTAQAAVGTVQSSATNAAASAGTAGQQATLATAQATLAAAWAAKLDDTVDGTSWSAAHYAADAQDAATSASDAVVGAAAAQDAAEAARDLANRYANGQAGVEVEAGTFSALHWSEVARGYARQNAALQVRKLGDAITSPYTIQASDLFKVLLVERTTAPLQLVGPLNLYLGPPLEGSDASFAWVQVIQKGAFKATFRKEGAGSGGTTTSVAPSEITANDQQTSRRPATQPAAVLTKTINLAIPAGVGRRVVVDVFSMFLNGTTGSADVACAQATNLVRTQGVGDGNPQGTAPIRGDQWTMDIADGDAVTAAIVITSTNSCQNLWARARAVQNCDGFESSQGINRAGTALTVDRTVTPSQASSLILFSAAFVGFDATPLSADPGTGLTISSNAKTDFNTALADFGYLTGYYAGQPAAAKLITVTSPQSRHATMLAISAKPRTTTVTNEAGSGLITLSDPAETTGPGCHATLEFSSNGQDIYLDI